MQKSVPLLVQPSRPTPHEVIPFTHGSVAAGLNTLVSNHLLVFRPSRDQAAAVAGDGGRRPADIIRSGLAQVLVPYYPLAGRIVENETGWEVQCNGRGAVFVVTASPLRQLEEDETITSTHFHQSPLIIEEPVHTDTVVLPAPKRLVGPGPPPAAPLPAAAEAPAVLTVQVTELIGGGFVLSIKLFKGICDTAGLLHFLCGWAEMSRGKPHVSVLPLWKEEQMQTMLMPTTSDSSDSSETSYQVHLPSLEMGSSSGHVHDIDQGALVCHHHSMAYRPSSSELVKVDVPFETVKALVHWLQVEENCPCNVSQALAAHVWRERTRALQIHDATEGRLFFISKAQETHPVAYYGSFAFNCQAKVIPSELMDAPLSHAVRIIQAAEANLVRDFTACTVDFKHVHCSCGYTPQEALVFTNLPSNNNSFSTSKQLDFGVVAKPVPPSDTIHFPSQINIAAVASADESSMLTIFMNNVPFVVANELRSLIINCNPPLYIAQDTSSRM